MIELNEETKKECEIIGAALDKARFNSEKVIQDAVAQYRDNFYDAIQEALIFDIRYGISGHIQKNTEDALEKILKGDASILEKLEIVSSYRYEELRRAIWEANADEIQKKVLDDLLKENMELKKQIQFERDCNRRY